MEHKWISYIIFSAILLLNSLHKTFCIFSPVFIDMACLMELTVLWKLEHSVLKKVGNVKENVETNTE
jgi:hypothetical protein